MPTHFLFFFELFKTQPSRCFQRIGTPTAGSCRTAQPTGHQNTTRPPRTQHTVDDQKRPRPGQPLSIYLALERSILTVATKAQDLPASLWHYKTLCPELGAFLSMDLSCFYIDRPVKVHNATCTPRLSGVGQSYRVKASKSSPIAQTNDYILWLMA